MSKLRDIINGVAVDGANTFGAGLKGIEPVTPNTGEVRIKKLIKESTNKYYQEAYDRRDHCKQCMDHYLAWEEFRQKVNEL